MISIDRRAVAQALRCDLLIEALAAAFRAEVVAPLRHRHDLAGAPGLPGTLLLMPSWGLKGQFGIKIVTVQADNVDRSLPTVQAVYLLGDATTGEFRAILDAQELTLRRTAAASALASRHLSRSDSRVLLMVGTGQLAPHLVRAHCTVRPIERVLVWGRTATNVNELVATLAAELQVEVCAVPTVAEGMATADIISCATLATLSLLRGADLRRGQHVDLVGSYLPTMREADDAAVLRSLVFVDSRAGVLAEAGELVQPLSAGIVGAEHIRADLSELVRGTHPGRTDPAQITLFKSVGLALEDLAAASLVLEVLDASSAAC